MNAYVVNYRILIDRQGNHVTARLLVAAENIALVRGLVEKAMNAAGYGGGMLSIQTAPAGAIGQLPLYEIDQGRLFVDEREAR